MQKYFALILLEKCKENAKIFILKNVFFFVPEHFRKLLKFLFYCAIPVLQMKLIHMPNYITNLYPSEIPVEILGSDFSYCVFSVVLGLLGVSHVELMRMEVS